MKSICKLPLLIFLLSHVATGDETPANLGALMANPPSISDHHTLTHKFEDSSVILESKDFIALITLTKTANSDKVQYRFRTYSKTFKMEVSGDGELCERYYKVIDLNSEKHESSLIDRGSKLIIDAGCFKATWSAGGYIYLNKGISAIVGEEAAYQKKIKEG